MLTLPKSKSRSATASTSIPVSSRISLPHPRLMPEDDFLSLREITGALLRRSASAFRTSVTDGIQHVLNCCCGLLGRKTKQRVFASDEKGSLAGMRIGAVLHPAVFLAFADSVSFEQNASRPSLDRAKATAPSIRHQHECAPAQRRTNP